MAKKTCVQCGATGSAFAGPNFREVDGRDVCVPCAKKAEAEADEVAAQVLAEEAAKVLITTTPAVDGYRVVRYLGIESVQIVVGSGVFSEFTTSVQDLIGARSTAFERKLAQAKSVALDRLKLAAHNAGGNAVIGIDLDYTEFSGNRIGLIANGTVVEISRGE